MRLILSVVALTCLLPLAGCTSPAERALRNSPDYRSGYSDGCSSASLEGANKRGQSPVRDDAAFAANRAYRSGWGAGYGACRVMASSQSPLGDPLSPRRTP